MITHPLLVLWPRGQGVAIRYAKTRVRLSDEPPFLFLQGQSGSEHCQAQPKETNSTENEHGRIIMDLCYLTQIIVSLEAEMHSKESPYARKTSSP
jgi:hypothetical protein